MGDLNPAWWIGIGIGVLVAAADFVLPVEQRKKWGRIFFVVGAAIILSAIAGLISGAKPAPTPEPIGEFPSLNCGSLPLPVSEQLAAVTLFDPGMNKGWSVRWFVQSAKGWPPEASADSIGKMIYRCEFVNYSA